MKRVPREGECTAGRNAAHDRAIRDAAERFRRQPTDRQTREALNTAVRCALREPLLLAATKRLRFGPLRYDVEDLIEDVFGRLYEKLVLLILEKDWPDCCDHEGERIKSPTAFLACAARNLLTDVLKAVPQQGHELDTSFYVVDGQSAPFDGLINEDRERNLSNLLDLMDASDRVWLVLRISEGWSYEQLGKLHGIKPGNARVRFHRALKTARELASSPGFSQSDRQKIAV